MAREGKIFPRIRTILLCSGSEESVKKKFQMKLPPLVMSMKIEELKNVGSIKERHLFTLLKGELD